jgi:hypothetical protein
MKLSRLAVLSIALAACEPTAADEGVPVQLTLRLKLAGDRDMGTTPGRVYVFVDSATTPRAFAFPELATDVCRLTITPVTTCTIVVPQFSTVSLIAAEAEPAVVVRFGPASPQDTVRDGRYTEFTSWTECPNRAERGLCVIRPSADMTIEGNFQLMQQVSVYQSGAASMDFITFAAAPTLNVPAQNYNILDMAGCRRRMNPNASPCDGVHIIGEAPFHRITAFVTRQTIFGMLPNAGAQTEFQQWDGDCILSTLGPGYCSIITPDTAGPALKFTARYSWWECPSGNYESNIGGCVLRGEILRR